MNKYQRIKVEPSFWKKLAIVTVLVIIAIKLVVG